MVGTHVMLLRSIQVRVSTLCTAQRCVPADRESSLLTPLAFLHIASISPSVLCFFLVFCSHRSSPPSACSPASVSYLCPTMACAPCHPPLHRRYLRCRNCVWPTTSWLLCRPRQRWHHGLPASAFWTWDTTVFARLPTRLPCWWACGCCPFLATPPLTQAPGRQCGCWTVRG